MDNKSENNNEVVNDVSSENVNHTFRITEENLLIKLVPVVIRQTDYTEEVAREKLLKHKFDLKKVLFEWMGVDLKKEEENCVTGSQERYRVIRSTMDDASRKFR